MNNLLILMWLYKKNHKKIKSEFPNDIKLGDIVYFIDNYSYTSGDEYYECEVIDIDRENRFIKILDLSYPKKYIYMTRILYKWFIKVDNKFYLQCFSARGTLLTEAKKLDK